MTRSAADGVRSTDSRDCTTNILLVPNTGYSRTSEYNASRKVVDTCP
jgi:hypothetical protein